MSNQKVLIICDKPATEKDISEIFARTAEMLEEFSRFMEKGAELDETESEKTLAEKMAPDLERLVLKALEVYPSPDHLEADILTFKSVFLKGLRNKKQRGN
jgi:hypothetical protein